MIKTMTMQSGTPIQFSKFEKDGKILRKFAMTGNSGAPMQSAFGTIIIDLKGTRFRSDRTPIFQHHDSTKIVGHTEKQSVEGSVEFEGIVSGVGSAANEVIETSDNGFPWQASVAVDIYDLREITEDESEEINGRMVDGPAVVLSETEIYESSFVPLGRDKNTPSVVFSAGTEESLRHVFEAAKHKPKKEAVMPETNTPDLKVLEAAKAEGRKEAGEQLQILVAEFSDDTAFAMDAFNRGLSLEAAKAEAYGKLKLALLKVQSELDELKTSTKPQNASEGVEPVEFKEEPKSANFQAKFDGKIKEEMAKGKTQAEAICAVSLAFPQLADQANGFA